MSEARDDIKDFDKDPFETRRRDVNEEQLLASIRSASAFVQRMLRQQMRMRINQEVQTLCVAMEAGDWYGQLQSEIRFGELAYEAKKLEGKKP